MRWSLFLGLLVVLVALTACGGGGDDGEESATGVIVAVQATSLTQLDSFTMRTNDGEMLAFEIAPDADRATREALVPGHLRSHMGVASQVEIFYREEDGKLLAVSLIDK